mgnify:CR=1 FL=1|jgi:hypothetical protein|tara:strand:+ start:14852 stop:16828 length:1977 start_codon:yes stop_codon:yes gene_type:complete
MRAKANTQGKKEVAKASTAKSADITPLMAAASNLSTQRTSTRRNRAADIERTDKYKNIDDGLIPWRYSAIYGGDKDITVRDAVILCQKAYYNFAQFRNVIDLMTEFSCGSLFFKGGSKKSRDFFEAFFNKINVWGIQDQFFREYYRSGNVFLYRFDGKVKKEDIKKMTQVFGASPSAQALTDELTLPLKYVLLNPADIRLTGNLSFYNPVYYKNLSGYEVNRLRNPVSAEDFTIFDSLPEEIQKQIQDINVSSSQGLKIPLDMDRVMTVFYKKQDYEPYGVPMGYPVLEDINAKSELKKMDMAIARTMQQAILLVTMGTDPEKGGINQRNLAAMQELFQNQSVGRVLISDYTTKAEFVIPKISELLDSKKYEIFDQDINLGLNNILVGGEKFANQESKIQVFLARLEQGRQAFLQKFLIPEIKKIAKTMGLKNYPTPYFQEISLKDSVTKDRVYTRLYELGAITADELFDSLKTNRLPYRKDSLESQEDFKKAKNDGFYEPIMGSKKITENINLKEKVDVDKKESPPKSAGRPEGTEGIPQEERKSTPVGQGEASVKFDFARLKDNMILSQKLTSLAEAELRKIHRVKRLNKKQKEVAAEICDIIICNEEPSRWEKSVTSYCKKPQDNDKERVKQVHAICAEHNVDIYLGSLLLASKF